MAGNERRIEGEVMRLVAERSIQRENCAAVGARGSAMDYTPLDTCSDCEGECRAIRLCLNWKSRPLLVGPSSDGMSSSSEPDLPSFTHTTPKGSACQQVRPTRHKATQKTLV
jgi:hypothetical protein